MKPYLDAVTMDVVPLEGTWIEIFVTLLVSCPYSVVPLEGTWIEIGFPFPLRPGKDSRTP